VSRPSPDIPRRLGTYDLLEEIGRGPVCTVWRGRRPGDPTDFALKILEPRYAEDEARARRFEDEARLAESLIHPHIVRVHELVPHVVSPLPFYVMDYIAGGNVNRFRAFPHSELDTVLGILLQACEAIDFIHGQGLVHCDVKPTNILLDEQKHAFLTDFGVTASAEDMAEGGPRGGTIAYMAPEQFAGFLGESDPSCRVDARSDIYSFGVVLYELTTGELPFRASNRFALIYQRLHSEPRPPHALRSDLPAELDRVILRAMARRPEDRFQTAAELADALRRCS
jgi:serine/threonine-protein kinase